MKAQPTLGVWEKSDLGIPRRRLKAGEVAVSLQIVLRAERGFGGR